MKYMRTRSLKRLFSLRRRILDGTNDDQEPLPTTATTKESEPATDKGIFPSMGLSNHTPPVPTDSKIATTEENLFPSNPPTWKLFSYEDIFTATNGFSPENMVGRGGYADVYQGTIPNTGKKVAVKKLTKATTEERREREFLTEIGTIGHASHPNVSSLLGCCIDNGLYLIFHLSPGGSVASRLHDEKWPVVEWVNRYKIAVGVAKGLHYLHKGCQRRIIHRDIKASNILLNDDYEPQISDFGLAKWLPTQLTHHSVVPIEGTVGCLAPEYFSHGIVDEKTDVFAFGVFLLELISGKRPVDAAHQSLRSWAKPYLKQGEVEKLVDPRLGGVYDKSELRRLVFTASICIRSSPNWRPTMSEVLELMLLEGEEMDGKKWEMPEKEEDKNEEEFWGFEALESDYEDDDDDDYNSSSTSFSASVTYDLISTGSS